VLQSCSSQPWSPRWCPCAKPRASIPLTHFDSSDCGYHGGLVVCFDWDVFAAVDTRPVYVRDGAQRL
jgi:hypothetical protein